MAEQAGRPVVPVRGGASRPLGIGEVTLEPGFWRDRQDLNAAVIMRHCHEWMERAGWIENFRVGPDERRGREFTDSDVYKLAEGMAWEVGRSGDEELERLIGEIAEAAAGAQEPDGYLNTRFGRQGLERRYTDLEWGHELYCYGHMFQAAVARLRTVGEDRLVELALRAADHVTAEFGEDGRQGVCGHPEIEMGLVELYRATGEERYLEQARLFVERRGRPALADIDWGRAYFQDDVPVREAEAFRGHAVRALYLACGAVDVAVETGDDELLAAIVRQWEHTVAARTYVTGGMGSRHTGESFGDDFELPADRAYSETCAGVASVMLSWRLLLATGEARFADLAERTLYNVVATSPALDGRAFFYANTLHQRAVDAPPHHHAESDRETTWGPASGDDGPTASPSVAASGTPRAGLRSPWFTVSCCPTNVARTLASLAAYVATVDDGGLRIHQLAPCTIRTTLPGDRAVGVRVRTDYPWSGDVIVRIEETDGAPWRLEIRVPEWAGEAVLGGGVVRPGYAAVERAWRAGDELRLELPVKPRWTRPDPRVDAVRGCVALERGPLVYCLESVDQAPGVSLDAVAADTTAELAERPAGDALPGAVALEAAGLTFVPYHLWSNRGPSTMRVWVPALTAAM